MIQKFKDDWNSLDKKMKGLFLVLIVAAIAIWFINHQRNVANVKQAEDAKVAAAQAKAQGVEGGEPSPGSDPSHLRVLPINNRNQGLEDLTVQIQTLKDEIQRMKGNGGQAASTPSNSTNNSSEVTFTATPLQQPGVTQNGIDMNSKLPPVSFDSSDNANTPLKESPKSDLPINPSPGRGSVEAPKQKIWEATKSSIEKSPVKREKPALIIPVNSALEAVMLSGIMARPSGSSGGAVGSVQSATSVGTPFVSRLKGNAILPNGYKVAHLGDCFVGGNGIANLSAERVNVITENISCIAPDGREWEGEIQAYGLDVDGTQGIAGHVVSKQGSILMQAALTGMASGLSSAFSPSSVPSYNSNSTGGTQQYNLPNPNMLIQSAVGQGANQATAALSRFYLQYASETFPVIEVTAGTRVTWILKKSVELKIKHGARKA